MNSAQGARGIARRAVLILVGRNRRTEIADLKDENSDEP